MYVLVAMIVAAAATRLLPHPPNLTAIGAVALFGGAYFSRRWQALLVPLAAMLLSDVVLTFTLYSGGGLSWEPVTYVCFTLTVGLGLLLHGKVGIGRVALAAIAASVMFFLVSNFAVWMGGKMYSLDAAGLVACYVAALPFAQNMLLGNLLYCGVLFGGMEALQRFWPAVREPRLVAVTAAQ
jgi:hypothetical protein